MSLFPLLENPALQAEMTARIKRILATDTRYAGFGNAGYIESYGRNIEDNANWVQLPEDKQALWMELRRKTELTTNPEDFWKAVAAVRTYLQGLP